MRYSQGVRYHGLAGEQIGKNVPLFNIYTATIFDTIFAGDFIIHILVNTVLVFCNIADGDISWIFIILFALYCRTYRLSWIPIRQNLSEIDYDIYFALKSNITSIQEKYCCKFCLLLFNIQDLGRTYKNNLGWTLFYFHYRLKKSK